MDLLLLTADPRPADVLPALELLPVTVHPAAPEAASLITAGRYDLVVVDARTDLAGARALCRLLGTGSLDLPVLAVLTEGGLVAVGPEWGVADVVLGAAGPAEVHARLRLLAGRTAASGNNGVITVGELTVEEETYAARLRGRALELTYKEFELLKFLAQHPGRVFTREQLVTEVWGYDFFGGTRTVDVHVRRLRAKLGPEHEALIGTVRNVGYKMVPPARTAARADSADQATSGQPGRSAGRSTDGAAGGSATGASTASADGASAASAESAPADDAGADAPDRPARSGPLASR